MVATLTVVNARKRKDVPLPALLGLDNVAEPGHKKRNKFFFESPLIAQRLSILTHMVGGSSPVIVVIGERGSGKTTLMNQFIAQARKKWQVGRIHLKAGKAEAIDHCSNLNNRVVFLSRKDYRPSIIVDDAHQLTPSELKLLLRTAFPADGERRLQSIVLFAEPELREQFVTIAKFLPPKGVMDKIFMTPLTEKQTADYLAHRVMTAGFLKKVPFTAEQIRTIHETSKGLPGWINGEAFLQLRRLCAEGRREEALELKPWYLPQLPRFKIFDTLQALARN